MPCTKALGNCCCFGKVFWKVLNRLVQRLDKSRILHKGQEGFRLKRSCVDNICTPNELVQGGMKEVKNTFLGRVAFKILEAVFWEYCITGRGEVRGVRCGAQFCS